MLSKPFTHRSLLALIAALGGFCGAARAAEAGSPAIPLFDLNATPAAAIFSDDQLGFVQGWIRQKIPDCPAELVPVVAPQFLAELKQQHPDQFDRLLSADFPARTFEPALLRLVGAQLTAGPQSTLRDALARRRVQTLLGLEPAGAAAAERDAAEFVTWLQNASGANYRRLAEGRMDEEDLQLQVRKFRQSKTGPAPVAPEKPKELTVGDLVASFSRANQAGNALLKLQALTVEGHIRTAAGEDQQVFLYKMRPNRFRIVVRQAGATIFIMGFDGTRFWQHPPGGQPQEVRLPAGDSRRYLTEFADPLFGELNAAFELRGTASDAGRDFARIGVRRADGSGYVARIDPVTFRQVGRESDDASIVRYSDFRDVAGVMLAYHEEVTDKDGRTGTFDITRVTPNPGLIQAFFEPVAGSHPDYYELEKIMVPSAKKP